MNNQKRIYPTQMKQILKEKGFVITTEPGFPMYGIPGVPWSFHTHCELGAINNPMSINKFNKKLESLLFYNSMYL